MPKEKFEDAYESYFDRLDPFMDELKERCGETRRYETQPEELRFFAGGVQGDSLVLKRLECEAIAETTIPITPENEELYKNAETSLIGLFMEFPDESGNRILAPISQLCKLSLGNRARLTLNADFTSPINKISLASLYEDLIKQEKKKQNVQVITVYGKAQAVMTEVYSPIGHDEFFEKILGNLSGRFGSNVVLKSGYISQKWTRATWDIGEYQSTIKSKKIKLGVSAMDGQTGHCSAIIQPCLFSGRKMAPMYFDDSWHSKHMALSDEGISEAIDTVYMELNDNAQKLMDIGIHGVLAQAESENISANVSWGINKRMQNGTYACRIEMLGYRRDKETKEIYIVPEEAEIVKKIFYMYLQGASLDQIKAYLEGNGIKTIRGNSKWDKHGIKAMLTNEKYVGDIIFQKTYRTDCLSKKVRINRGEKDRYLVSNNHPAIIDRETFWLVKKEMNKRSSKRRSSENAITELGKYSGKYALSELLFCDVCGSPFRRKTWTRNGVKRVYWRCLGHIEKGSDGCNQAKGLEEKVLHEAICRALTKSIPDKDDVKNLARTMLSYSVSEDQLMLECRTLENSIKDLLAKANDAEKMCIRTQGNKEPYYEEIKKYYLSVAELRERLSKLKEQLETSDTYQAEMKQISDWLEEEDVSFDEYDDTIVRYMISSIRVTEELNLVISFKGGGTVTEPLNLKL